MAVSTQELSEGREIRFDSNDRLKFRRRRLIGRSVVSVYHAKEVEEFPGFFFFSLVQIWRIKFRYQVQTIEIYHHQGMLIVPFHGSVCKRMMKEDIRDFVVATPILQHWHRKTVLTI